MPPSAAPPCQQDELLPKLYGQEGRGFGWVEQAAGEEQGAANEQAEGGADGPAGLAVEDVRKKCANCSRQRRELRAEGKSLRNCGRCLAIFYCSADCQVRADGKPGGRRAGCQLQALALMAASGCSVKHKRLSASCLAVPFRRRSTGLIRTAASASHWPAFMLSDRRARRLTAGRTVAAFQRTRLNCLLATRRNAYQLSCTGQCRRMELVTQCKALRLLTEQLAHGSAE